MLYRTQPAGGRVQQIRWIVEIEKRHVIVGRVEAGGVGHVEEIQAVPGMDSFGDRRILKDGNVSPLLERSTEDISSAIAESGLSVVAEWPSPRSTRGIA